VFCALPRSKAEWRRVIPSHFTFHINIVAKFVEDATPTVGGNHSGFSIEIAEILILRPCCRH